MINDVNYSIKSCGSRQIKYIIREIFKMLQINYTMECNGKMQCSANIFGLIIHILDISEIYNLSVKSCA